MRATSPDLDPKTISRPQTRLSIRSPVQADSRSQGLAIHPSMTTPIFLSPALPSELLSYILNNHVYPSTLIICSPRVDFLASLVQDIRSPSYLRSTQDAGLRGLQQGEPSSNRLDSADGKVEVKHALLSSPLYQVATSRHIRVVYVPTVAHLRAYLSVFSPEGSGVPAPPTAARTLTSGKRPHILLYGLVNLHRDTSEWSAQGLSSTISNLVDLAHRLSWGAVLIEPQDSSCRTPLEELLREAVPTLNGGARRLGPDSEEGAWTGRTVEVGRILGRWFRFQGAQWDIGDGHQ
ncbi:hypothetical protein F5Y14DRAFT_450963 [Nemania sp. NC0429]|nr:hypothetical protein F5Y14DRAFT_450963 [Nemania sp. NC0429]